MRRPRTSAAEDDLDRLLALAAARGRPARRRLLGRAAARVDTARELGVRRRWPATCSPTARSARAPPRCAAPYADRPDTCGHAYARRRRRSRDHVVACTEAGLQAGFHCIGDAAARRRSRAGFERGRGGARRRARCARARHRLEHVEMPSTPATIATHGRPRRRRQRAAGLRRRCGAAPTACTPSGSATRVARRPTRSRDLADGAASALAFGSDSPVTPLGPVGRPSAPPSHHHDAGPAAAPVRAAFDAAHPRRLAAPPATTTPGAARRRRAAPTSPSGTSAGGLVRRPARPDARHAACRVLRAVPSPTGAHHPRPEEAA